MTKFHDCMICQGLGGRPKIELQRALTTTTLKSFGMDWNADCTPGLVHLKSVSDSPTAVVAKCANLR